MKMSSKDCELVRYPRITKNNPYPLSIGFWSPPIVHGRKRVEGHLPVRSRREVYIYLYPQEHYLPSQLPRILDSHVQSGSPAGMQAMSKC